MPDYVATMTKRGQVPVPSEVLRILGAGPGDRISFLVDGNAVLVVSGDRSQAPVPGSAERIRQSNDLEELSRIAKEEKAARTFSEMNDG